MACYEGDRPVDFLDVYREEEEIRQNLDSLTGEARERYLCEIRNEPYPPDLQREIYDLTLKLDVYRDVLKKHGCLKEADALYAQKCDTSYFSSEEMPVN